MRSTIKILALALMFCGCLRGRFELKKKIPEDGANGNTSSCVDPDLTKVQKDSQLTLCDGTVAFGLYERPSACASNGQKNCLQNDRFKGVNPLKLEAKDIRIGTTLAGITGTKRVTKQCRNAANLGYFDASYLPTNLSIVFAAASAVTDVIDLGTTHGLANNTPVRFTTSATLPAPLVVGTTYYVSVFSATEIQVKATPAGGIIDLTTAGASLHVHDASDGIASAFDTIDDFNQVAGNPSPSNGPWGKEYICNEENFTNVSTEVPPSGAIPTYGNQAFTQVWRDELSGMLFTNVLYDGTGTTSWADAYRMCEGLNGGAAGSGWHLPTQKEAMQLHIDGVAKVPLAGGTTNANFWASSSLFGGSDNIRWSMQLALGESGFYYAINVNLSAICVR